jgi:hypothetical protein
VVIVVTLLFERYVGLLAVNAKIIVGFQVQPTGSCSSSPVIYS